MRTVTARLYYAGQPENNSAALYMLDHKEAGGIKRFDAPAFCTMVDNEIYWCYIHRGVTFGQAAGQTEVNQWEWLW